MPFTILFTDQVTSFIKKLVFVPRKPFQDGVVLPDKTGAHPIGTPFRGSKLTVVYLTHLQTLD